MADLEGAVRKLATLEASSPYERVFVIRQILDNVHRKGYEDGYHTAIQDKHVADMLDEATIRDAAKAERTWIMDHFNDLIATAEYRRRFEDRHAQYLGEGTTIHGVLAAVVEEIDGMKNHG